MSSGSLPYLFEPFFDRKNFSAESMKHGIETYFSSSITITAETAVGKSTTLRLLREKLSPMTRFVSGGDLMRARARQLKLTIEEFAAHNKHHPEDGHDLWLDYQLFCFGKQNYVVTEGRLAHMVVPDAFSVKLVCPLDVRAERRLKDRTESTFEIERNAIEERDANDNDRYKKLYPGCLWPDSDFNLVIDTSTSSKEDVVSHILDGHTNWMIMLEGKLCHDVIMS